MKLHQVALSLAALLISTSSFAGLVSSSSNIDFLAIDGQKANRSLLKEARSFNATAGQKHQVVVRVSEIVRSGTDRTLFESDPIVVAFQGDAEDIIISAPRLDSEREANKFKEKPQIIVKTVSGKDIPAPQEYLKQEGFLPNTNLVENLSEYNASKAIAAVPAFAASAMPAVELGLNKAQKGKVTVQGENVAEQMLQYWYQQADKETQKRFLNWVNKQ